MMKSGNVIMVRHHFRLLDPASWLSWAIRKLDNCYYNHCAIVISINDKQYIVEARSSGVYMSTITSWLEHRPYKKWVVLHPQFEIPVDIDDRILAKLGTPYDKESLFVWHPIRLLLGVWRGGKSESGSLTCSELVALIYKEQFPNWFKITPGDLGRSNKF